MKSCCKITVLRAVIWEILDESWPKAVIYMSWGEGEGQWVRVTLMKGFIVFERRVWAFEESGYLDEGWIRWFYIVWMVLMKRFRDVEYLCCLLELRFSGERRYCQCIRCVCYVTKLHFVSSFGVGVSDVLQSSGESGVYIGSICRTSFTYVWHYKSPFTEDYLHFIALFCVWYAHYSEGGLEGILT